ncbi:MAG: class I SAM-dependent methyltransferase, partial [Hoeflea sp.]|nr:class I SAM-dependent methyltransferase [Hoeflea sp.]
MSNDDPFTLDLFNTTTLSSGLGLGVTAFGSDFGAEDFADERPSPPARPEPHAKPVPRAAGHGRDNRGTARGQNLFLESDRGLAKGWKQRARD